MTVWEDFLAESGPKRALEAHLREMSLAAATIEDVLGGWAQQWCRQTAEAVVAVDLHRTHRLQASGSYPLLLAELEELTAGLPERIRESLSRGVWRHLFVDVSEEGRGGFPPHLDYVIWQEDGNKIPPAYEPVIVREFGRLNQLLRKYGYRPSFGLQLGTQRYSAPPEAIAPMETYRRLLTRLPEVVAAARSAGPAVLGGRPG